MGGRGSGAGVVPIGDLRLNKLYKERGAENFRKTLNKYSEEDLKSKVKSEQIDRTGKYKRMNKEKLVNLITDTTERRATQGDVFKNYGKENGGKREFYHEGAKQLMKEREEALKKSNPEQYQKAVERSRKMDALFSRENLKKR